MSMKGTIKQGHMPLNKVKVVFIGLPPINAVTTSEIEDALETVDLPDRTRASGGHRKPFDFSIEVPMHHLEEQAALEKWFKDCQDPVSPDYKKAGTMVYPSIMKGKLPRTYSLVGALVNSRTLPAKEMTNEGEPANVKWGFSIDDIQPI